MKTIYCLGDSNTWGYDPRGFFENQYDHPWPELLGKQCSCTVINGGENGRTVPAHPAALSMLETALTAAQPELLLILLGTNDALMGFSPEAIAERMENLLLWLGQHFPALSVFLLAPPGIRLPEPELQNTIAALPGLYEALARKYGLNFMDLQALPLPLACDGVHLTQEAHNLLAAVLAPQLK